MTPRDWTGGWGGAKYWLRIQKPSAFLFSCCREFMSLRRRDRSSSVGVAEPSSVPMPNTGIIYRPWMLMDAACLCQAAA